jgi:phosphopantothenoylcysteine decarboxylase/phosphopantothenate--cysteine ligase
MSGLKILVTSGATREPIDEVRFISNVSTGKTGASLADFFQEAGFDVTYLGGEGAAEPFHCRRTARFSDFASLDQKLQAEIATGDYFAVIHLAAVSDYSVQSVQVGERSFKPHELKKIDSGAELALTLRRNYKIVDRLKSYAPDGRKPPIIVAFKLTNTKDKEGREKAVAAVLNSVSPDGRSAVDAVVHNDLGQIRSGSGQHRFELSSGAVCNGVEELGVGIVELFRRYL